MKENFNLNYSMAQCALNSLLTVLLRGSCGHHLCTVEFLSNFKPDILTELVNVCLRLHNCFCQMIQPTQSDVI